MSESPLENAETLPATSIETGSVQLRASALTCTVAIYNVQVGRHNHLNNHPVVTHGSTPRDFEDAIPNIGGILVLRSENVIKKVNYDKFCEKIHTYIMNELKNGDTIVEITKNHSLDVIGDFENNNKPVELTDAEKKSTVDVEIHK